MLHHLPHHEVLLNLEDFVVIEDNPASSVMSDLADALLTPAADRN